MRNIKNSLAALVTAILVASAAPSFAATGTSIAPEIMSQSKAVASVISSRIHVLWSDFVDKQIDYTNDPDGADAPRWATEIELSNLIGGEPPEGITFREVNMPAARNDSFELEVTVGPQFGGAASARYIGAYLPTATVNGNIITVPVVRPAKALGLADMHLTEFWDVSRFEMEHGANIEMDDGNINGVNQINSRKIVTYDLDVQNMLTGKDADFSGDVDINGDLTVGPNGNNGHIYLGNNGYIHGGTNSTLTIGGSTNTSLLSKLVVNATKSQFKGNIEAQDITLIKNGVTTTLGSKNGSSFTIDSTQPILLSQSGNTVMELARNEVDIKVPMMVHGDIMPGAHNTYNIGSSAKSWKNIYASGRFYGNVTGNVNGWSTDLNVNDTQDNPYGLNVTWAKNAARAVNANSADNASKFFNEGGNVGGILYANKGVMARGTGNKMWDSWNQAYGVNGLSKGAMHNTAGGAFVGLNSNATIYFGRSYNNGNSGQYYGWVNSGGYYNRSSQRLATEAFVNGKGVYVNNPVSQSFSLGAATVPLWSGYRRVYNVYLPLTGRQAGSAVSLNWSFTFYNGEVSTDIRAYIGRSSGGTNYQIGRLQLWRQWNGYTSTYRISGTVYPSWAGGAYLVVTTNSRDWDDTGGSSKFYGSSPTVSYTGRLYGGMQ